MRDGGKKIGGLYVIADAKWNPCATIGEYVSLLVEGGCRLVQLRMKGAEKIEVMKSAREIMRLKRSCDFTFIINDHADVAADVGADGVHVGENDAPVYGIKSRYGDGLIVGYSSHSVEEAKKAATSGADYVALGAIFPTKTKGPGHPVQGLKRLSELKQSADVPVVAIGGITRGNFADVINAGADSVAMITAIAESKNVVEETKWFVERLG